MNCGVVSSSWNDSLEPSSFGQAWEQDKNPQPQTQQTTQTTTTAAGSAADQGVPASGQGKMIT
ncbi:hypothetical protein ONO12_28060, partial [Salmonella enterica subsp. enterica serovar Montevideo]|nr:hypothetical protein [Salmonella enterica subsp. enterica serovar Montevideo]